MSDLWRLTAHEAHEKLRAKEFSSLELTRSVLDRIAEVEPKVHAYITNTPELALEQAREADSRYASGTATPLTGIPVAVKDLIVTKGTRTTASRIAHGLPVYGRGRAAATVTRTIEKLEGEGIIRKVERGTYVFTEPLFGRYVREITPAPR